MQFFAIPMSRTYPCSQISITLSDEVYTLYFRYNTRMDRWVLDIRDASEQPILCGIKMLIDRNFTSQYTALSVPLGGMFVQDDSGLGQQPTLSSFLLNHTFYYADPTT